ncbi:hypothetical protein PV08_07265 [Exophiala spinifera]|uniref:Uncharacterized protein n=1 Tax=Exophiala spinifera TaxID=91928 RepID=A0A0D1YHU7_9EURO|nr:uncharacterized protein PV08_07265 [Exophiala spinifera]KIW14481.1 hypothetical protein PV08_07265 [Exophiala spinifera]
MPLPLPEILDSGNLTRYDSSSTCQRWFCRQCGASTINIDKGDGADEWEVATGLLHFVDGRGLDGRLKRVQLWVDDVKGDGGAVPWINQGRLLGHGDIGGPKPACRIFTQSSPRCTLPLPNVVLSILRPDDESSKSNHGKFEAGLDACTSCRLVSGFEVTSWLTVPRHLIKSGSTGLNDLLSNTSKLHHYKTSPDVGRYFCAKCGATVFYYKQGLDTIDIGTGLLEPLNERMVRVENWLAWQKYPTGVAYQEDAVDKDFIANLAEGMHSRDSQQ